MTSLDHNKLKHNDTLTSLHLFHYMFYGSTKKVENDVYIYIDWLIGIDRAILLIERFCSEWATYCVDL